MKRHPFGINFDEGLPLESLKDFELLYVDAENSPLRRLIDWLKNSKTPLMFGGQIGVGKSTLIKKATVEANIQPDITIHFDYGVHNATEGGFLRLILTELLTFVLEKKADLSALKLPSELLPNQKKANWKDLLDTLRPSEISLQSTKKLNEIDDTITENSNYFLSALHRILDELKRICGKEPIIFASGIDKFNTDFSEWFSVQSALKLLSDYKTLYEVNALHLLQDGEHWKSKCTRITLTSFHIPVIEQILKKRLGDYEKTRKDLIPLIAVESGGNPRQAIRLLIAQEVAIYKLKKSEIDAYDYAVRSVTNDFFVHGVKPEIGLLNAIDKGHLIESTLLNLPGDKETARRAVFGNWIILQAEPNRGTAWSAIVNPLVKKAVDLRLKPEDPEVTALRQYANQMRISSNGLGFDLDEFKDGDFWKNRFSGLLEEPLSANITEVLNILGAALLSKDRQDRVIIAFKETTILEVARAYLFAKANSFEYQTVYHRFLDAQNEPFTFLSKSLAKDIDILSFEFAGDWSDEQLLQLDKYRDLLLKKQIIWWIQADKLNGYLSRWVHLRQLFQVLVLEDELLASLNEEDIKADIAFFEELVEIEASAEAHLVKNLKTVLDFLKKRKSA